jgi:hypothetical protein
MARRGARHAISPQYSSGTEATVPEPIKDLMAALEESLAEAKAKLASHGEIDCGFWSCVVCAPLRAQEVTDASEVEPEPEFYPVTPVDIDLIGISVCSRCGVLVAIKERHTHAAGPGDGRD